MDDMPEQVKSEVNADAVAALCARIADDKKAQDVVVLDLRALTFVTDYFVIATGTNPRQIQAIADDIMGQMKRLHVHCIGVSGMRQASWILLDYSDVVVHLFSPEFRALYDLELLWGDAPKVEWESVPVPECPPRD